MGVEHAAHVVNNAYGVQSSKCVHELEQAMRRGRVDAVVQSLDKNFLMPVGGALVCSPSKKVVAQIATFYPGRASNAPALDFFITMLQMVRSVYMHHTHADGVDTETMDDAVAGPRRVPEDVA